LSKHLGCGINDLNIGEGSDRILKTAFELLSGNPQWSVVIPDPGFPMYGVYASMYFNTVRLVQPNNGHITAGDYLPHIDDSTSLIVVSNPYTPYGTTMSFEDITVLARSAKQHSAVLLVDEAYIEFSDATSAAALINSYPVIVVRTLSKAGGAAGLRIGYSLADQNLTKHLRDYNSMNALSAPATAWIATLSKYEHEVTHYVASVIQNRRSLQEWLTEHGIDYIPSQTNFINIHGRLHLDNFVVKHTMMLLGQHQIFTRISIPALPETLQQLKQAILGAL
jgi:histidinol-phosphate aminotransferase